MPFGATKTIILAATPDEEKSELLLETGDKVKLDDNENTLALEGDEVL